MKKSMISLLAMSMMASFGAAQADTPIEKEVPIENIYSPIGFDSNDSTEIVVEGYLPNLCHKAPASKVEIVGNEVKVKITSLYYEPSSYFCPEMIVPFTETVSLGLLNKGKYKITVNGETPYVTKSEISVAESTSNSVDDFDYAYVEYIEKKLGSRIVKLKGYNPSDCFELDKIDYASNGKDTYSVLPKMKQIRSFCPMKMIPFEYDFEVPNDIQREKVLLHVRTMDGKSVNSLFSNN
jgi:hypothetical protein